mmetsp:Transcript_28444/g.71605  ORF Transcript_28444/g.71605 Transcript_28444/m.71605 type:complete len:269 (-) Transcript_28444:468-1274(-)
MPYPLTRGQLLRARTNCSKRRMTSRLTSSWGSRVRSAISSKQASCRATSKNRARCAVRCCALFMGCLPQRGTQMTPRILLRGGSVRTPSRRRCAAMLNTTTGREGAGAAGGGRSGSCWRSRRSRNCQSLRGMVTTTSLQCWEKRSSPNSQRVRRWRVLAYAWTQSQTPLQKNPHRSPQLSTPMQRKVCARPLGSRRQQTGTPTQKGVWCSGVWRYQGRRGKFTSHRTLAGNPSTSQTSTFLTTSSIWHSAVRSTKSRNQFCRLTSAFS